MAYGQLDITYKIGLGRRSHTSHIIAARASKKHKGMSSVAGIRRMTAQSTVFMVCDVQERFASVIYQFPALVHTSTFMAASARVLGVPMLVTEQYPKAFKHTVPELRAAMGLVSTDGGGDEKTEEGAAGGGAGAGAGSSAGSSEGGGGVRVFEKTKFSMCTPEVNTALAETSATAAVIFGLEAHVCVQQTCLDLLAMGIDVHIVVDAVSSQRVLDRSTALERMKTAGAVLTTAESVVMTLLEDSKHPNFREVAALLKVRWGGGVGAVGAGWEVCAAVRCL